MISEALHVFTDPGHILAEAMFACVEAVIGGLIAWVGLRRHDRKHHPVAVEPNPETLPYPIDIVVDPYVPPNRAYLINSRDLVVSPSVKQALITNVSGS